VKPEKVHVIPCGVPVDESIPAAPGERNGAPPQFIAVSRILKLKGVDITIRAFAGVVREIPEARLFIAGDGPDRPEFEALVAELGLTENVHFAGWLSEDEVRQQLRQSDVFVQHSLGAEGWPVGVAEASAMRLPVVVTSCGGLAEQVVDGVTGLIVPTRDVDRMRQSMLTLARDPDLRAKMGTAGRERMVQGFNVKGQIAKLEQVLLDCARTR
jgi:colanic acid/amylovoran biosynthesis glycosyltransferase